MLSNCCNCTQRFQGCYLILCAQRQARLLLLDQAGARGLGGLPGGGQLLGAALQLGREALRGRPQLRQLGLVPLPLRADAVCMGLLLGLELKLQRIGLTASIGLHLMIGTKDVEI